MLKKNDLLLCIGFLLGFCLLAEAQESKSADEVAVRRTVQYYIDGWTNVEPEKMKKAFHPKAKFLIESGGNDLREASLPKVVSRFPDKAERAKIIMNVVSLDITGEVASVKVDINYPEVTPKIKATEYLLLIKFSDGWKIVSKVRTLDKEAGT